MKVFILISTGEVPPFIDALKIILEDVSRWMLYLVPAIIVLTFVIGGIMLVKAEDGMESKSVKGRMFKSIIGAAIAAGSTWIGKYLCEALTSN